MITRDLVVIGGGSAGMAAALSAHKNGIKDILILEREKELGGILEQCIHSGFGLEYFKKELTGPEYAELFANDIILNNIEYKTSTTVLSVTRDKEITYSNMDEGYQTIKAKSIILATGCQERNRGSIMLAGDRSYGVITAGLAQKYLNIMGYTVGKNVFILGSGDIGLIMARRMTLEGANVIGVAELMPYSNGLNRNIVQCLNDYNIPLYLSTTVTNVYGKDRLERIELSKVDENRKPIKGTEIYIDCDTLLLSVGLVPSSELLANILVPQSPKSKGCYVNNLLETKLEGVFSCGNCLHVHDLVDFVTKESIRAGRNASRYLKGEFKKSYNIIKLNSLNNIGYVLPNEIDLDNTIEDIVINFRVNKPLNNKSVIIRYNEDIIYEKKKQFLLPAELEEVILSKDLLTEDMKELVIEVLD